jgi:AcrR family transcriptional regulator
LSRSSQVILNPRKSPVQERSVASVDAILEATIQVLLQLGKEQLTTTRVAMRAGVSVGTLYQYFPNKSALLRAVLERHLSEVADAVELVCEQQQGQPLRQMATALINSFLEAKMSNPKASAALYAVSSDVDGAKIAQEIRRRFDTAIIRMLETAAERLTTDLGLVTSMLQGAMVGVSRRILESSAPEKELDGLRRELIFVACAYLDACAGRLPIRPIPDRMSELRA